MPPQPTSINPRSINTDTVHRYVDGFRKDDHEQILSCLTDDIRGTVFGGFRLHGKEAYDATIPGDGFVPRPRSTSCARSSRTTRLGDPADRERRPLIAPGREQVLSGPSCPRRP
jgi:hypothetical protein